MSSSRFARLDELFHLAVDLAPEERAAFLDGLGPEDAELRDELGELLAADQETAAEAGLQRRVQDARDLPEVKAFERTPSSPGDRMGPYRILTELGRGGLGTVFLAERDDREFSRRVALKVVRPGMESENVLERLRRERQILAELDHPNIARLFDGGATAEGLPYFAMELIEGERIDAWCQKRGTPFRQRIEMLRKVCEAVHYAHRKLVLHRDLKPSNILVGENGEPKLLDFGIAKVLGTEGETPASILAESPTLTETGHLLLTPEFASPEQVRGETLSTASDVYSLGVILYQLVTGSRPYEFDRRRFSEVERVICQVEPVRASEMARRCPELAAPGWQPASRGDDLDNILAMALRKEPERRYLSAADLAEDLRRYLEDLPISARADTTGYRLRKFARRHRWGVLAGAAMVCLLLATVILTTWQARIARQERARAEGVANFLLEVFRVSDPYETLGNEITAREILDRGAARMKNDPSLSPDLRADLLETMGKVYRNLSVFEPAAELLAEAKELRESEGQAGDPAYRRSLLDLARLDLLRQQFSAAERWVERVEELDGHRWFGAKKDIELKVLNARISAGLERFEEAETQFGEALDWAKRADPGLRADVLDATGDFWQRRSESSRARPFFEEALRLRESYLDRTHPLIAESRYDLARAFMGEGKAKEAEAELKRLADQLRATFGDQHASVADVLLNLAQLKATRSETDEAERLYLETLELRKQIFGEQHPKVAEVFFGMARIWQIRANLEAALADPKLRARHLDRAEELAAQARDIDFKAFGEQSLETLRDRFLLAELALARGNPAAEAQFAQIVRIIREKAPEDPRLANSLVGLAKSQLLRGAPAEAEEPLREALKILESREVSPFDASLLSVHTQLAFCLESQARLAEALVFARASLEVYEANYPAAPVVTRLRNLVARASAGQESGGFAGRAGPLVTDSERSRVNRQ